MEPLNKDKGKLSLSDLRELNKANVIDTGDADNKYPNFIKTEHDEAIVEAIISLWDIDEKGQIMKNKEVSF